MKNHFIFAYAGNKRNECEDILKNIDFNNIETIIEPFCGTSAISYYISTKYPKKFKYILNDTNNLLIELYQIMENKTQYENLVDELEKTYYYIFDEQLTKDKQKERYLEIIKKNDIISFVISHKYCGLRAGLFPIKKVGFNKELFLDSPVLNFLRNEDITIMNNDGKELLEQYNDKSVLFILDPPYLESCNSFYKLPRESCDSFSKLTGNNKYKNIYEYLSENTIDTFKSKIILILEDNWIIRHLFNKNIIYSYDKNYVLSKKKTTHIIISN